jgi:hypothetical protein
MPDFAVFILAALSTARVWKLLAKDDITWFARKHLVHRYDDHHWIRKGLDCPWCFGYWLSWAIVPAAYYWHPAPILVLLMVGASSEIVGKLHEKG